jgi:hypothetical protein
MLSDAAEVGRIVVTRDQQWRVPLGEDAFDLALPLGGSVR